LLQTHLEGVTATAGITGVALELVPVRPAGSQMQIFERGMRDPNRFAETLAQIEAIVGHGNAGRAKLLPSRALDAFEIVAFLDEPKSAKHNPPDPGGLRLPEGLPLRRFRPCRLVDVTLLRGRPTTFRTSIKNHFITQCSGPWLVSGDWWGEARWQREVWEVETSEGTLYQLTRHNGQWQLEGVFG
jgi:protein ImuB